LEVGQLATPHSNDDISWVCTCVTFTPLYITESKGRKIHVCNTYIAPTINVTNYSNIYGVMVSATNVMVHFNVTKFPAALYVLHNHTHTHTHTKQLGYIKPVTYESGLLLLNQQPGNLSRRAA
jgi:hypothetical protein